MGTIVEYLIVTLRVDEAVGDVLVQHTRTVELDLGLLDGMNLGFLEAPIKATVYEEGEGGPGRMVKLLLRRRVLVEREAGLLKATGLSGL